MPAARKIFAKAILSIGIALGAGAGVAWLYLMWQTAAAEEVTRFASNSFWLGMFGAFGLPALVIWPFAAFAELIDPPLPARPATADNAAASIAGPESRLSHSKILRRAKRR